MIYILDAGAVMNTTRLPQITGDIMLPQSVQDEIKSQQAQHLLAAMEGRLKITVSNPLPKYIAQIRKTARDMGQNKLSTQDTEVLALALMMAEQSDIMILSDDYGLRNVAHQLDLPSQGVTTTGGDAKRTYRYICRACGTSFPNVQSECDICGHQSFQRKRSS